MNLANLAEMSKIHVFCELDIIFMSFHRQNVPLVQFYTYLQILEYDHSFINMKNRTVSLKEGDVFEIISIFCLFIYKLNGEM